MNKEQNNAPFYLVDGSGYIFRAYYAVAPLSTRAGLPTNALFGFTRMFIKLLGDVSAQYIAVAFDTGKPNFRHKLYPEYKANRAECPEDLVPQMPYFRSIVRAFGIESLEAEGYEADDVIATIVSRLKSNNRKIIVVSGDKDLTQLVDDQVEVWDPMRDRRFDSKAVIEKFGVAPCQIGDYLALTGDSSDNIPGAKGVGPKTAVQLISHFGNLDSLIERSEQILNIPGLRGSKRVCSIIESSEEVLRLSRQLVALDTEVPSHNKIDTVEQFAWSEPVGSEIVPLFRELEFEAILEKLDVDGCESGCNASGQQHEARVYQIIDSDTLEDFVKELEKQDEYAFDTETTSLDIVTCDLAGISFSWCPGEAYYLPIKSDVEPHLVLDWAKVASLLAPVFGNEKCLKVGFNLKYDIAVLARHGLEVKGKLFDCMLASYGLNPEGRQHSLKNLAQELLGETMVSFNELTQDAETVVGVPLEQVVKYACNDADASLRLKQLFDEKLGVTEGDAPSLRKVFEEVENPLVPVLANIELAGIKVDTAFLQSLEERFAKELIVLEERIHELAGCVFNLNSPKQLGEVLFVSLGIPTKGVKRTKSGFSTNAAVLNKIKFQHPIVGEILEYRELFKLQSTYVQALGKIARPDTGRIHSSFNQAVTATGRLSSSSPNLQNIPIRNPRGREIRNAFIARDGFVLVKADYSQIELRVLAHLSGDEALQSAFREGEDIHLKTATELFGAIAMAGVDRDDLRRAAKTINFGVIYGMGAFRLAGELRISRSKAARYIDDYFDRYPKVRVYFDCLSSFAKQYGYVETLFGRRRYVKDLEASGRDAGYIERSLMNAPIQGTAAEIIKVAMINAYDFLAQFGDDARMVLQVHDELVFEIENSILETVRSGVVAEMENAVLLSVPLCVDVSAGRSWGDGG